MRLWFYNNVRRHLHNIRVRWIWWRAGKTGPAPVAAAITAGDIAWANSVIDRMEQLNG